jgi:hypothetical protein
VSPTVVSNLYGVNEKTVRDIWSGRTWSKEIRLHLDPSRAAVSADPSRCQGVTFKIDPTQAEENSSVDDIGRANDHFRDGAITLYSSSNTWFRSQEHSQDSLTRSMASKVHEGEQPVSSCVISIDEQLYEWERRGFWLF